MANTRFIRPNDNRTTVVSSTNPVLLKNGGGGAPPLIQLAAYPMSNLLVRDRYTVWATGPTATNPIYVHIDIGINANLLLFGMLGLRAVVGGFIPASMSFGFRTQGQGYSVNPADYTAINAIFFPGVDSFLQVAPQTNARYLQFTFSMPGTGWGNGFTLGKLMASSIITDIGFIYAPDMLETIISPQIRTHTQAGLPILTATGLPYSRLRVPFRSVDNTTVSTLQTIGTSTDPFVYWDRLNVVRECLPSGMEWQRTHIWSPPDTWDFDLEFDQLP